MTYFIIFIVFALVLSPVMWMMPSPSQKRQMKLRSQAMSLGLSVKVCDLPQLERAKVRNEPVQQGIAYLLRWRASGAKSDVFHHLVLRAEQPGIAQGKDRLSATLQNVLVTMPGDVMALEYTSGGVSAYWREKGTVEDVDQIHQSLLSLTGQLDRFQSPSGSINE